MARPKGSNQAKPTRSDVIEFYKLLREKAHAGDVNAAGWLVVADTQAKAKPGEIQAASSPKAPPPAKTAEPPQSHLKSAKAWKPAHEAMIDHVMACTACRAPQGRYCEQGADLRRVYLDTH